MKRDLGKLSNTEYDVLIIGGGIYGVTATWDAVLRGLKVALIERGIFVEEERAEYCSEYEKVVERAKRGQQI